MKGLGWTGAAMAVLAIGLASCGGSTPPPSTTDPGGTGERISGSERLGWNQAATGASELAMFRYAAYVDGSRVELADVACTGPVNGTGSCNSRMPAMTPGAHSLELVSFVVDGATVVESARSAPLRVTVAGATAGAPPPSPAPPATPASRPLTTSDGAELRLDTLTEELEAPTAIAPAPGGRVFVAEQEGRIRIARNGVLDPQPAITIDEVLMTSAAEGGLLAIALDAQFERTHFLYAIYTISGPEGTRRFRLVRYREVDGRLGERVVLLDAIPAAARPAAALTVGSDGRLYAAFDAGPVTGRTAALASFSGKILRLNTDGTTPTDQPAGSPVFASAFQSPRGLDWHPETGALWVVDAKGPVEELRIVVSAGNGQPESTRRGMSLPPRTGASALAFYRSTLLPALAGDLFVAAEEGRALLRLRFDERDPMRLLSTERLLEDADGRIRAVAAGPDGFVFVATDRALLRLGPN